MKALPAISYAEACRDPHLFGDWFDGDSWDAWRVIDKALFGEPLDAAELAVFTELTGRTEAPTEQATEAWFIIGRRGGKDIKTASIAAYLATIGAEVLGFRARLKRGEKGVVQVLAVDRDQAKVAMGYLSAMFEQPMLKKLVTRVTADSIELSNSLAVEITTNDQRRARGRTVVCVIFDEVAHWKGEDSTNPDEAIYKAVKPGMATMSPGALLVGISSPHMRVGLLHRKFKDHYGKDGNVLVVKAPTWRMNPTLPRDCDIIREAFESDPAWASAEYGAEFRTDLEPFLSRDAIEACIDVGVFERAPNLERRYIGFVDPSGGRNDSMTLSICHIEGQTVVQDVMREIPSPFNPESATVEFVSILKRYRCSQVVGDAYGAEWVQNAFTKAGCFYQVSEKHKSGIYLDFAPIVNSGAVSLLDHPKMVNQLAALERQARRGSRDSVDHPRGAHDDVANAVAGAVTLAARWTATFARFVSDKQAALPPGVYGRVGDIFGVAPSPEEHRRARIRI